MRLSLALLPLFLLAGCGGGEDTATPVTSTTPIAQVAAPGGQQWTDVVSQSETGFVQGNPNAPIKLVEYGSRTCPTCGRFAEEGMEPLRSKYISTGKVSYEFRDFPLHGAPDIALALLNRCAGTAAFFPMLDQMFANQSTFLDRQQQLSPALIQQLQTMTPPQAAAAIAEGMGMIDFVKQRGIPEAKARQCLADQAAVENIAKVFAEGTNEKGVQGTPSFFLNDRKLDAATWAQVEPALQAAGAR